MRNIPPTTADLMTEARERLNLVSVLEEVRGTVEPDVERLLEGMSAVHTHERNGVQLYEQYGRQTSNRELKETWQEFGEETRVHMHVAERVISALGGDPSYQSPAAMDIDRIGRDMLNVQATGDQGDLVRLGNVMMAETLCRHHWQGVNSLARRVKDTAMAKIFMDAARIVERDEDQHVRWNTVMFDRQLEKVTTGM